MNSFIENVNYLASLDNNYGDGVVLNKSNLSLRNVANDITLRFSYFNYNTREIETVTKGIQGMLYTGLEAALQEFIAQIEATLGGNKFDASYTISSANTGFLIHSFSITINSLDEKLKCTEINFNAKITSTQVEIYNLYGNVTNPLKLLAVLAMLDLNQNFLNNISTISENIENINNTCSNIEEINTVSSNINSVNNVSSISDDIVIASGISNAISSVALIDDNITIVANNIDNVNINANNIANINSIASTIVPNINEILLVDDKAAQVAIDTIAVENDRAEVAAMKLAVETIYDTFDDRFLGTKTIDPTSDNDGNALLDGALYFNTSSNTLMVYDAVSLVWIMIPQLYLSTLLDVELSSITTGDILNWNGTKWVNTRAPKVDSIQLNGGATTEGIISWNADEGTADLTLPGGSTLQIGQENIRTVRNATASTILNGRLCMFDGTIRNSGRIKVKPFTAGFNEAMYLYGVATQNIISGSDGIITIEGKVRGIDTTGASVGEVWHDEDILYAKPNDNGMMTNVMPTDNELKLVVATVIKAHTNGTLEIRFTPLNENMYYTKVQNDILLNNKVNKNSDIVASTGTKITYDSKGLVTGSTTLSASDIPSLDASKITSGTLSVGTSGSAAKITTARNIAITGDITWSTSFDGSTNVTGVGTLANSGVTAGTYNSVTVDSKGRVTNGTNPTTISGYGITDTYTKTETNTQISNAISGLVDAAPATLDTLNELAAALGDDPNFATTVTNSIATKVVKNADITAGTNTKITYDAKGLVTGGSTPTTLAGYSIANAYTKTEVDSALALKVDDTEIASVNLLRADKYLAAQNIASMVYTSGDLTKIQYRNATDVDYEVLNYTSGNLTSINHYTSGVLRGTTTLSYSSGNLVSAIYA